VSVAATLDDYRWLVSSAAEPWLARVSSELIESEPTVGLVARLRKDLTPERAHLVIEQVELRRRAREKFTRAERMFFTRQALEQATDELIAAAKAARFSASDSIADVCCGIGGDLIALASTPTRRASEGATGVERDPAIALLAEANLRVNRCPAASVVASDAANFPVADFAAWHIDPDRRPAGHRTSRVEFMQPELAAIDRLLAANPHAAVKFAPAADAPPHWRDAAELCWLGNRGQCRQQVAWFGSLAREAGQHTACVVDACGGPRLIAGQPGEPIPVAATLGRYLYEPHAAILAARLTGAICARHSLAAVATGVAYLTTDALLDEPGCEGFEVLEVLPLDIKHLRAYCRGRHIGRLELKKRGVDIDPNKLRPAIIADGDNAALLIITPLGPVARVLVARRIETVRA
jgi:THUMP domain-containing protein